MLIYNSTVLVTFHCQPDTTHTHLERGNFPDLPGLDQCVDMPIGDCLN